MQEVNIKKEIPNIKILKSADELISNYDVYIVNENVLKRTTAVELYNNFAKRIEGSGFVTVLYKVDKDEKRKFLEAWLKALTKTGCSMSIIPISKVSVDKKSLKIDERVLTADIVALSVKPFGIFIVEETTDPVLDLKLITRTFNEEKSIELFSTNIENFNYIGYIGWTEKRGV